MRESGLCLGALKDFKAAPPYPTLAWPGCHGDAPVAPEAAAGSRSGGGGDSGSLS